MVACPTADRPRLLSELAREVRLPQWFVTRLDRLGRLDIPTVIVEGRKRLVMPAHLAQARARLRELAAEKLTPAPAGAA
jgi:hypothetical protein